MHTLFTEYLPDLVAGTLLTLRLTVIGFALGVVVGAVLATCRISPVAPLRMAATVYVEFFRNVPLVSLLLLTVYGLPYIDINLGYFWSVVAAMAAVGGAFACETFRTGINSIGVGQVEAARSIGLTFSGIVRELILPQALRTVIGPTVTLFIGILLSSSLAAIVGMRELTATVSWINNRQALGLTTFAVAAAIYAGISLLAAWLGSRAERRYRVLR